MMERRKAHPKFFMIKRPGNFKGRNSLGGKGKELKAGKPSGRLISLHKWGEEGTV